MPEAFRQEACTRLERLDLARTANGRMSGSPDAAFLLEHRKRLLATAPTRLVIQKQGRYGPDRLWLGHLIENEELHCSVRKGTLRILYRKPWKIRHIQLANLLSEAVAMLGGRCRHSM